jgi:hypothetical protein
MAGTQQECRRYFRDEGMKNCGVGKVARLPLQGQLGMFASLSTWGREG